MYYVYGDECIDCGWCYAVCPEGAIESIGYADKPNIDQGKCKSCGECSNDCPVGCIRYQYDPEEDPDFPTFNMSFFENESVDKYWGIYWNEGSDGTDGFIDCSHLVWRIYADNGLYYIYKDSYHILGLDCFDPIDFSDIQDGDILVWQGHHMAVYCINSIPSGSPGNYNIYTTTSNGVKYGASDWWTIDAGLGQPIVLRWKGGN